jgi:ubiquinone/menaquinone biosynthesis C-methylase UbiE
MKTPRFSELAEASPSDPTRRVRDYYDAIAAEFNEMDQYWSNPYDTATWNMENSLVEQFLAGREPLLDLGVGFYPHVESAAGRRLVNVDLSCESLRIARRVYHQVNPRMTYACGDALQLPFRDGAFSGIMAGGELVNHVALEPVLREIHRVLAPAGRASLSVAMKWCLDSLYAVADAFTGGRIGYSMSRREAARFLAAPGRSVETTWEVTPDFDLKVTLYSRRDLLRAVRAARLRVLAMRSLNVASGLIPLPLQQDSTSNTAVKRASDVLLSIDRRWLGRVPGLRWFAGNVYIIVERP